MTNELNSESDLEKAHHGAYDGFGVYLRQISNEAKARNGIEQIHVLTDIELPNIR